MASKNHIIYNPQLSIEENASNNKVSVSAIRNYIDRHKISRRYDNAKLMFNRVQELKKKQKEITITEIAEQLGCSYKTAKKYFQMESLDLLPQSQSGKYSTLDMTKLKTVIKSFSTNQDEIIGWILRLYIPNKRFDVDLTYSIGNFYKRNPQPLLKFDKYPQSKEIRPLEEFYNVENNSIDSVVLDLPFLAHIPTGNLPKIQNRFNAFESLDELVGTYRDLMSLSSNKLTKGGILVIKTQDLFHPCGKQIWVHKIVEDIALDNGFQMIDLFILINTKGLPLATNSPLNLQRHSRKLHSYFLVFQKKGR